jgi:hypothetical protein
MHRFWRGVGSATVDPVSREESRPVACEQAVEPAAAPQVEHDLVGTQAGDPDGVAAAHPHDHLGRHAGDVRVRVANRPGTGHCRLSASLGAHGHILVDRHAHPGVGLQVRRLGWRIRRQGDHLLPVGPCVLGQEAHSRRHESTKET